MLLLIEKIFYNFKKTFSVSIYYIYETSACTKTFIIAYEIFQNNILIFNKKCSLSYLEYKFENIENTSTSNKIKIRNFRLNNILLD